MESSNPSDEHATSADLVVNHAMESSNPSDEHATSADVNHAMESSEEHTFNRAVELSSTSFGHQLGPVTSSDRDFILSIARHQTLSFSGIMAGMENTMHQFARIFNSTIEQVSTQIKISEERTASNIKSSEERMDEKLNTVSNHVDVQLDDLKNQILYLQKNADKNDNISQAWLRKEHVHLRQIISFIRKIGLDTTCSQGMTPLIHFEYLPDAPQNDDHLYCVLSKANLRLLHLHADKFTTAVSNGIQTAVDKIITPIFNCLTTAGISQQTMREFGAAFPCDLYVANGVYVFRISDLIRMMKEELDFEKKRKVLNFFFQNFY